MRLYDEYHKQPKFQSVIRHSSNLRRYWRKNFLLCMCTVLYVALENIWSSKNLNLYLTVVGKTIKLKLFLSEYSWNVRDLVKLLLIFRIVFVTCFYHSTETAFICLISFQISSLCTQKPHFIFGARTGTETFHKLSKSQTVEYKLWLAPLYKIHESWPLFLAAHRIYFCYSSGASVCRALIDEHGQSASNFLCKMTAVMLTEVSPWL